MNRSGFLIAIVLFFVEINYAAVPQPEYDALRDLYIAWGGSNWIDNTNWPNFGGLPKLKVSQYDDSSSYKT